MKKRTKKKIKRKTATSITREYIYLGEFCNKLYRKTIVKYLDGSKKSFWEHWSKSKKRWVPDTGSEGRKWDNGDKPLFNLPDLYKTRNTNEDVWFCEGEKDVLTLQGLNLIATCHCIGSAGKWHQSYGAWMKGRDVNLLPDNDDDGMKYSRVMAEGAVETEVAEVRIIKLPNPEHKPGYDVTDWVEEQRDAGKTDDEIVEELEELKQSRRIYKQKNPPQYKIYMPGDIMKFEDPKYIVKGIIPESSLCLLFGPPFGGKTFMAISLAVSITSGRSWVPGGNLAVEEGSIFYIATEGKSDYKYRMLAAQQNYYHGKWNLKLWNRRAGFIFEHPKLNTENIETVLKTIDSMLQPPLLTVVDTIRRTLEGTIVSDQDMDNYIQGAERIIDEFGCAILLLGHTPRNDPTRFMGSQALAGAADIVMGLQRPRPEMKGEGPVKLECQDARWGPFDDVYFNYKEVIVDEAGHVSLYLQASTREEFESLTRKKERTEEKEDTALDKLRELSKKSKDGWVLAKDWGKALKIGRTALRNTAVKLVKSLTACEKGGKGGKEKLYKPSEKTEAVAEW